MSDMQQSVDALAKRYEWWEQAKALPMLASLQESLQKAGPKGRLCRRPGLKADGSPTSWLYVVDGNGTLVGSAFNDSWLCPPFC